MPRNDPQYHEVLVKIEFKNGAVIVAPGLLLGALTGDKPC